jgi:hypothetical protein
MGTWDIKDSIFHYTIELSSAPASIPVGSKGESEIVGMSEDELVAVDRMDGSTNIDFRVK